MGSRETVIIDVKELIGTYTTQAHEGRWKKVDVSHDGFEALPEDTRKLIEAVLKEVYRGDFEIIREAFFGKLEFFLRLIADALREAKCSDTELRARISATRKKIADINRIEVSDEDIKWLREIGFLPVDIFELTAKLDIVGAIAELRKNINEYKSILGNEKYIVEILKRYDGLNKLKRLMSFYQNYDKSIVKFNGSHLAQIVSGHNWEEKLTYFENPENLNPLRDAGFSGSHLAQIVSGPKWEWKLQFVLYEEVKALLTTGRLSHSQLARLLIRRNWLTQLQDLVKLNLPIIEK